MHTERPKMVLTLFMPAAGYHKDSWRAPDSRAQELGSEGSRYEGLRIKGVDRI